MCSGNRDDFYFLTWFIVCQGYLFDNKCFTGSSNDAKSVIIKSSLLPTFSNWQAKSCHCQLHIILDLQYTKCYLILASICWAVVHWLIHSSKISTTWRHRFYQFWTNFTHNFVQFFQSFFQSLDHYKFRTRKDIKKW